MAFAEKLKELRKDLGITQKEAAKYIGVTCRTFQNYESGYCMPRKEATVRNICEFFDIQIYELLAPNEMYVVNMTNSGMTRTERDVGAILSDLSNLYPRGKLSNKDTEKLISTLCDIYWESKGKKPKARDQ